MGNQHTHSNNSGDTHQKARRASHQSPIARNISSSISFPRRNSSDPFLTDINTSSAALDSNTDKIPVVLRWNGNAKEVFVTGSFTNWEYKLKMVPSQSNFMIVTDLPKGDHEYKFCVDGEWKHDETQPSCKDSQNNKNNLISVKTSDFEVFEALEVDKEVAPSKSHHESYQSASPPNSVYGQESVTSKQYSEYQPPKLPPHLSSSNVHLNCAIPKDWEPGLLTQPNHVILNHLYALSVKDKILILSCTNRYRKKYVTTILYEPIDEDKK